MLYSYIPSHLSPPSNELVLQSKFRYDSRNCCHIQLNHKKRGMFYEKDASIAGECACFNSLFSAEKRVPGSNSKQNGANYKGFLVC